MARKITGGLVGQPSVGAINVAPTAVVTAAENQDITISPTGTGELIVTGGTVFNGVATATVGTNGIIGYAVLTTTGNLNDVDGNYLVANSGAITLTLPLTTTDGRTITLADGNNFQTNVVTVGRNTRNIAGLAENLIINVRGSKVTLVYYNSNWNVFAY